MGYLRAGQEAPQDRWGQMLLGYPRKAQGEAGSLDPSSPQSSSCPHPPPPHPSTTPPPDISEPRPIPTVSPFCPGEP